MKFTSTTINLGSGHVEVTAYAYEGRGPIFTICQTGTQLQFSLSDDTSVEERAEFATALVAAADTFAAAVFADNTRLGVAS